MGKSLNYSLLKKMSCFTTGSCTVVDHPALIVTRSTVPPSGTESTRVCYPSSVGEPTASVGCCDVRAGVAHDGTLLPEERETRANHGCESLELSTKVGVPADWF